LVRAIVTRRELQSIPRETAAQGPSGYCGSTPPSSRGRSKLSWCGGGRAFAILSGAASIFSSARIYCAFFGAAMIATTLRRPPHGHCKTSSPNTRFNRSAHGSLRSLGTMDFAGVFASSPSALFSCSGLGTSFALSALRGANTPKYLVWCDRGGGTRLARPGDVGVADDEAIAGVGIARDTVDDLGQPRLHFVEADAAAVKARRWEWSSSAWRASARSCPICG